MMHVATPLRRNTFFALDFSVCKNTPLIRGAGEYAANLLGCATETFEKIV